MRIRFLLHDVYGPGGGVVTVTLALAEELARRHDVELVSAFGSRGRPPVHRLPAGVPVRDLMPPVGDPPGAGRPIRSWAAKRPSRIVPRGEPRYDQYSLYSDLVLRRYLGSLRDGALVTMQPGLNLASARYGSQRCVRVAQEHRPFVGRPRPIIAGYQRYAGGLDALLTLTRADAKRYRKLLGKRVPVRVIGNGMPNYDGPLSPLTDKIVVAAGRLERTKGFDVLIDAWVDVAAAHPDWQLQIWGEGTLRGDLTRQIHEAGLVGKVHLKGFSTQLPAELSRASVFVLSSRAEGYPRVILEAMACGLPVISTDCPSGPREMIDSGVDGLLVPNQDARALGAAVNDLIGRGPAGRARIGEAGLARARGLSQAVVAQTWEDLLAELLARKASKPST